MRGFVFTTHQDSGLSRFEPNAALARRRESLVYKVLGNPDEDERTTKGRRS